MSKQLLSLWPEDLAGAKLTPKKILEEQARELEKLTAKRLRGSVTRVVNQSMVHLSFEIIADQLEYTHRLFEVTHGTQLVYPVHLKFSQEVFPSYNQEQPPTSEIECADDSAFMERLADVLRSSRTKEIVTSLLARIDELREENGVSGVGD
ncbi:MAG: hypothetical protein ACFCD0_05535 [Gemmataceae bacterium]